MGMSIVGLSGLAGSGKSFLAKILVEEGYRELTFAEPIKAMVGALLAFCTANPYNGRVPVYEDLLEAQDKKNGTLKDFPPLVGLTPRRLMQTIGTEWGRNTVKDNLWVSILAYRLKVLEGIGVEKVVVTDCRFPNEATFIRGGHGGKVVRVLCPNDDAATEHASERGLDDRLIDGTFINRRDLPYSETVAQFKSFIKELYNGTTRDTGK